MNGNVRLNALQLCFTQGHPPIPTERNIDAPFVLVTLSFSAIVNSQRLSFLFFVPSSLSPVPSLPPQPNADTPSIISACIISTMHMAQTRHDDPRPACPLTQSGPHTVTTPRLITFQPPGDAQLTLCGA